MTRISVFKSEHTIGDDDSLVHLLDMLNLELENVMKVAIDSKYHMIETLHRLPAG